MSVPPALANGLPALSLFPNAERGPAARFQSAWDAWQFACGGLANARRLHFLAELVGDEEQVKQFAAAVRFFERAAEATRAEWQDAH